MKKVYSISFVLAALFVLVAFDGKTNMKKEKLLESTSMYRIELIALNPIGDAGVRGDENTSISPWAFPSHTLDLVDSYVPFIFRTKKSAQIDELKIIISVNDHGKIDDYEVLNENADKGLIERIGYVVRNMPRALPVPGFDNYDPMRFELIIKK